MLLRPDGSEDLRLRSGSRRAGSKKPGESGRFAPPSCSETFIRTCRLGLGECARRRDGGMRLMRRHDARAVGGIHTGAHVFCLLTSDSLSRRSQKFRIRDEHVSLSLSTQFVRGYLSTTSASLRTTHETLILRLTTSVTGRYGCDAINRAENERWTCSRDALRVLRQMAMRHGTTRPYEPPRNPAPATR